jgi:hypothetical protein
VEGDDNTGSACQRPQWSGLRWAAAGWRGHWVAQLCWAEESGLLRSKGGGTRAEQENPGTSSRLFGDGLNKTDWKTGKGGRKKLLTFYFEKDSNKEFKIEFESKQTKLMPKHACNNKLL